MASKVAERGPCPCCKVRPRSKSSTYCKKCGADKARAEYAKDPAKFRKAAKRRRKKDPEKAKAAKRKYAHTEKGRRTRQAYRRSEKGRQIARNYAQSERGMAAQRRGEEAYREKLRGLTAALPIEVVRPFVQRMVIEAEAEYISSGTRSATDGKGGYAILAKLIGIPKHRLRDIAKKKHLKSVNVKDADRLAMYGDFSLSELYERAEEWALLTGSKWPKGYHKKRSQRKKKCYESRTKRENRVLAILATEDLDQARLALRLGYTHSNATSKLLRPMVATGKIEEFKEPGCLRKKYRLAN